MGDLLKETIADAKAVRETALANAKLALEEAFTPQLKSMLSAKLKEDEFEDEEEIPAEEGGYMDDSVMQLYVGPDGSWSLSRETGSITCVLAAGFGLKMVNRDFTL